MFKMAISVQLWYRFASYFKSEPFNVKDALDFFIAQTARVEVFVPLKT
jgi:hypothetical protein